MASFDSVQMNCARCGRLLRTATVTITTRGAEMNYGPVCARKMGLIEAPRVRRVPNSVRAHARRKHRDANQMELIERNTA